jgi:hypothetical protein
MSKTKEVREMNEATKNWLIKFQRYVRSLFLQRKETYTLFLPVVVSTDVQSSAFLRYFKMFVLLINQCARIE